MIISPRFLKQTGPLRSTEIKKNAKTNGLTGEAEVLDVFGVGVLLESLRVHVFRLGTYSASLCGPVEGGRAAHYGDLSEALVLALGAIGRK